MANLETPSKFEVNAIPKICLKLTVSSNISKNPDFWFTNNLLLW